VTREAAVEMIRALFAVFGSETTGLNDKDLGGIMLPEADVFFEYDSGAGGVLICRGSIHTPKEPFTVNELEAFTREAASGAPCGGGHLEYMTENGGIFLVRSYGEPVPDETFISDIRELVNATQLWRREVLIRAFSIVHRTDRRDTVIT